MTDAQQREAARQFFYRWNGKGREDEDARSYSTCYLAANRNLSGRYKQADEGTFFLPTETIGGYI